MTSKVVLTVSALLLAAVGLLLNFAPDELALALGIPATAAATAVIQVLAAALLGMGILNWFSRLNRVGGIYGRPLALGNLLLFGAGALALGRGARATQGATVLLIATIVSAVLAISFAWLIFLHDPVEKTSKP